MKLKSIYLVSMALLAGVFAACNDNDVENFDNQVYINGSAMTSTVLLKNTVSDTEGSFRISMARCVHIRLLGFLLCLKICNSSCDLFFA